MQEAAGYILYVLEDGVARFLMLRNAKHHTWGFPKGKLERGEDPRAGALRELAEETGITKIRQDPGFLAESTYELPRRPGRDDDEPATKRVRYYLGRARDRAFERSSEHDAGDWMLAEEAVAILQHADLKRVLRDALAHVRKAAGEQT